MKFVLSLMFIFLAQGFGISQNLVPNGSFEDTIPRINNPTPTYVESVPPWFAGYADASPDYFSGVYNITWSGFGTPLNFWGYQVPVSGFAFVGFGPYTTNNKREFISVALPAVLLSNHNYYLKFYVSLPDSCYITVDRIGAYFSVDTPSFLNSNFGFTPQVENPPGNIIIDTINWTPIEGYYLAQGGEKVITFGNFYNNFNTQISTLPFNNPWYGSYFYMDEVTLIDCTATSIQEIELPQFNLYPNPAKDILNIESEKGFHRLLFYNSVGVVTLKFSETLETNFACDVAILPKGIYIVAIEDKYRRMVYKKFVKM
nr:T9SS type A sorting domain-containing protein [Bacteroidota bacterium]